MSKKNITFIIPSLRAGGAERVMSTIAQGLDTSIFSVTLVVIGYEKDVSYQVEGIEVIFLNKPKVRAAIPAIFNYLMTHKTDVIISAIAHLNTVMALLSIFFRKTKFVGRETIVRSGKLAYYTPKKKLFSLGSLQKHLLDTLICQSEDMKEDLINNYNYPKEKMIVINNPVSSLFQLKPSQDLNETIKLITIGRLEKQKGYLRLLSILGKLELPFSYKIIGKGSQKDEIMTLASSLNISDKIEYIPFTDDVQSHLQESDIYLQGSYVEGFPNALLESCAVGTPVVAFEAPGGINEIVLPGVNGYAPATEDDFLAAIHKIWSDKNMSPEKIRKSVVDRYHLDIILGNYEDFLKEITEYHKN